MVRRLIVLAVLLVPMLLPAGGASSLITEEDDDSPRGELVVDEPEFDDEVAPLTEQARAQQAQLLEHHAQLVEQREQIEQTSLEHQDKQQSGLGDRAPRETVPPMETIPPPHAPLD